MQHEEKPSRGVIAFHAIVSIGLLVIGIGMLGGVLGDLPWMSIVIVTIVYYEYKRYKESTRRTALPWRNTKSR